MTEARPITSFISIAPRRVEHVLLFLLGLFVFYRIWTWWIVVSERSKKAQDVNWWVKFIGIIAVVLAVVVMCVSNGDRGCRNFGRGIEVGDC